MSGRFGEGLNPPEVFSPDDIVEQYNNNPLALLQTYEYFTQSGEFAVNAKEGFLRDAIEGHTPEAPAFSYPKLDVPQLFTWRDDLSQLLDKILCQDLNDEANRLTRENVTTRLAEVGIMLLTKIQTDSNPADPEYDLISWQLKENMREVYGKPGKEEFQLILGSRLDSLKDVIKANDLPAEISEAAEYIREAFPADLAAGQVYTPQPETMQWYGQQLQERCAASMQAVNAAIDNGSVVLSDNGELDSVNIIKATELVLNSRGYKDWKVQSTTNSNIDTSQADKTIYIPRNRRMSLDKFNQVIVGHEVDEHVGRRINGDSTGVAILGGLGCSDYLQWEEGNGKANESLMTGKVSLESSAFGFFLTGGFIMGLDRRDGKERNFGETFDIVWRLRLLEQYAKGEITEASNAEIAQVMDKAYSHTLRLFRGTDGKVAGVFYPKDSVNYYLGQIEVWRKWDRDMELDEESRLRERQLERSAKINPLRMDHRRVAERVLQF